MRRPPSSFSLIPLLGVWLFSLFTIHLSLFSAERCVVSFNRDWTFNYFPEPAAAAQLDTAPAAPAFDDSAWPAVAIPHTWMTYETTGELHPYIRGANEKRQPYWWTGWGWYRKHFTVDSSQAARKVFIELDGVQKYCRVYLNGEYVADHKGAFHSFSIDLTDRVRFGADNVLAIAVSNKQNDEFRIPVMDAGNWDLYGGIYRNTRLVITDRVHVPFQGNAASEGGMFIKTPKVTADSATVEIRTWIKNDSATPQSATLVTNIIAPGTKTTVFTGTATTTLQPGELRPMDTTATVSVPQLWSPDTPVLYAARATVTSTAAEAPAIVNRKSEIVNSSDSFAADFGIRTIRWQSPKSNAKGRKNSGESILFVNDKPVNLQGFCRHQEYPWLGDAMPAWVQLLDLRDMKENLSCTFFRSGHYTTDRVVYDYCDRNGLIVVEDVPNVKDKNFNDTIQEQQVREMVRRDRNRPSIFCWSMGDESNKPADTKWAREEDPTRFIHWRDCKGAPAGRDKYITIPSDEMRMGRLMSCTIRGWTHDDIYPANPSNHQITGNEERQHLAAIGTPGTQGGSEGSDGGILQRNLIVWLYEDHGCDRTYQNEPVLAINPKGWVDAYRFPKYAYYLWQANHNTAPMVFVHPHYWTSNYIGQKHDFIIDSNCDTVELRIDDKLIATQKPARANSYCVTFKNVLVTNGTLTAIGKKSGYPDITHTVPMNTLPARLTLTERHDTLEAARDTVVILTADIVDASGNHVQGAVDTLHWTVTGPATLVGAPVYENDIAKNMSLEGVAYTATPISNIIRSTGEPGEVTVRVQSPGLALGEIKLTFTPRATVAPGPVTQPALANTSARRPVVRPFATPMPMDEPAPVAPLVSESDIIGGSNLAPEYMAYTQAITKLASNTNNSPAPADVAFIRSLYDRAWQIGAWLETTSLPPAFIENLRAYYAMQIILRGNVRMLAQEKSRYANIPVSSQFITTPKIDGVDLRDFLAEHAPAFTTLTEDQKETVLYRMSVINPWIVRTQRIEGDRKTNNVTRVITYGVPYVCPTLLPPLDWLLANGNESPAFTDGLVRLPPSSMATPGQTTPAKKITKPKK